jgi:hypothetical protein
MLCTVVNESELLNILSTRNTLWRVIFKSNYRLQRLPLGHVLNVMLL